MCKTNKSKTQVALVMVKKKASMGVRLLFLIAHQELEDVILKDPFPNPHC